MFFFLEEAMSGKREATEPQRFDSLEELLQLMAGAESPYSLTQNTDLVQMADGQRYTIRVSAKRMLDEYKAGQRPGVLVEAEYDGTIYLRLKDVPHYQYLKWSGTLPIPQPHERVNTQHGQGLTTGYMHDCGYLYAIVDLDSPPQHVIDNNNRLNQQSNRRPRPTGECEFVGRELLPMPAQV